MKGDHMGTDPANPSPRELPLSNQTRFSYQLKLACLVLPSEQLRCSLKCFAKAPSVRVCNPREGLDRLLLRLDVELNVAPGAPPPLLRFRGRLYFSPGRFSATEAGSLGRFLRL